MAYTVAMANAAYWATLLTARAINKPLSEVVATFPDAGDAAATTATTTETQRTMFHPRAARRVRCCKGNRLRIAARCQLRTTSKADPPVWRAEMAPRHTSVGAASASTPIVMANSAIHTRKTAGWP